jgi:hypothetical protein
LLATVRATKYNFASASGLLTPCPVVTDGLVDVHPRWLNAEGRIPIIPRLKVIASNT